MKRIEMITGMAAMSFFLAFVGALSAQDYDGESSDVAFERIVVHSSDQFNLDANRGGIDIMTTDDSLEDLESAYYYQMIEDQYIDMNGGQMQDSATLTDQLAQKTNHPSCKC